MNDSNQDETPFMLELRRSKPEEINAFIEMEISEDASEYIIPYSKQKHLSEMMNKSVIYLSIYQDNILSGFIILVPETSGSVEFRRIVISTKGHGFGQAAICKMEKFCAEKLGCTRIWLDVFESNFRGRHIYEKYGYNQTQTNEYNGHRLMIMEKHLS